MSEGMQYHAEGGDLEGCKEQMQTELDFLANSTDKAPLYIGACAASEAAEQLKKFTEAWPDPFHPNYQYASPWANKKENKGKKEGRPPPYKPPMQKGEVNL